jgi:peptide/nickel transport system ATP-binding protein
VPPVQTLEGGHQIKCHLSLDILKRMEPVIQIAAE